MHLSITHHHINNMTTSSASTSSFVPRARRMSWLQSHFLHFSDHFTSSTNNTLTTTCNSIEDPSGSGFCGYGSTSITTTNSPHQPAKTEPSNPTLSSNTAPVKAASPTNPVFHSRAGRLTLYIAACFGYLSFGVLVFQWLEAPVEDELGTNFLRLKAQFINDYGLLINGMLLSDLLTCWLFLALISFINLITLIIINY